ncbi:MAG: DNA polymerase III subunit delta' [Alphaproteobacteria bacterium]|nr:DNA polymerase III subunit delta' [Alphaproteobacteria bacterium]
MSDDQQHDGEGGLPLPAAATELLGHGEAERLLLDAWNSGRMPHAWLFAGPPGIGKATLAFRLAKFVLSGGGAATGGLFGEALPPANLAVDPEDAAARLVSAEAHPDLRILRREQNKQGVMSAVIRVDDVRAFESSLHFRTGGGGWRVAIVDEAERMNRNSENALLKILEEPPSKTLIIIISNALNGMLPTTRSRCRRLMLAPLPDDAVAALVMRAYPDILPADLDLVLRLAEGSPGRALEFVAAGGADLYRNVAKVLGDLPEVNGENLHALAGIWGGRKPKEGEVDPFRTGTDLMMRWIDRAIRAANHAPGLREIVPGDLEAGRAFIARTGVEAAFRRREAARRLIHLESALNLDRKQVLIDAVHTLAYGEGLERRRA